MGASALVTVCIARNAALQHCRWSSNILPCIFVSKLGNPPPCPTSQKENFLPPPEKFPENEALHREGLFCWSKRNKRPRLPDYAFVRIDDTNSSPKTAKGIVTRRAETRGVGLNIEDSQDLSLGPERSRHSPQQDRRRVVPGAA